MKSFIKVLGVVFFVALISLQSNAANPYKEIDYRARHVPNQYETSIKKLTEYLVENAKNDFEKTRAIYIWITNNIAYDTQAYFSGNYPASDAKATFMRRSSVCQGYAELFKAMSTEADIKSEVISGYSKGYGYSTGQAFNKTDHAWNAVELDGKWYLVDSTWGAGHINDQKRFKKDSDEFYFLTPPENFIYSHLPEDPEWQLLSSPLSKSQFGVLVKPASNFFNYGLSLGQPRESSVEVDGEAEITFEAPENVIFTSKLDDGRYELPKKHVWFFREGANVTAKVRFPKSGQYTLQLFAKPANQEGMYDSVIEYKIKAQSKARPADFPETFSNYDQAQAQLISPLQGTLDEGKTYVFKIKIPGAEKAAVIIGKQWVYLEKDGDEFSGSVVAGSGTIKLSAKTDESGSYWTFAQFEGR